MNKVIAILVSVAAISTPAFGDGTVLFSTTAATFTKVSMNSSVGGTSFTLAPAGGSFYYALFGSATASSVFGSTSAIIGGTGSAYQSDASYVFNDSNWSFVSYGESTSAAGEFRSSGLVNSDGTTTIPFAIAGTPVSLVAIGWSANLGTTYENIESFFAGNGPLNGWVGESAVATIPAGSVPGTGIFPTQDMFGVFPFQAAGLQLGEVNISSESPITPDAGPIPEPTTIALGLVGGLACLALRRKPF